MKKTGWDGQRERFSGPAKSLRFGKPRRRFRFPFWLLIVVLIGGFFWLVPPLQPEPGVAILLTGGTLPYTPFPTFTPLPRPTREHGGRIVYTCTRNEFHQLCAINADGSEPARLTSQNAHDYYPNFSPQGDSLVFASNRNGSFDLYLLIMADGKLVQLTDQIGNVYSPDFSPDSQTIVFANQAADGPSSLWTVSRNGDDPRLLYTGANPIVGAAWSPQGDSIAYAMSVENSFEFEIFLLNPYTPSQPPRRISQGLSGLTGSLDWSPDGKYLLVCAGPINGKDVYRLDVATGEVVQLTDTGNNAAASYSPDGQWIAFNRMQPDGQTDLFIMRADGTDVRQLTDDPEPDWQPQWWP